MNTQESDRLNKRVMGLSWGTAKEKTTWIKKFGKWQHLTTMLLEWARRGRGAGPELIGVARFVEVPVYSAKAGHFTPSTVLVAISLDGGRAELVECEDLSAGDIMPRDSDIIHAYYFAHERQSASL